ncbi:MAG: hypothetical protein NC393_00525 [Clostridium sp.]|nr:hypothetical protein [Clostridium sp.]MCM1207298.1 hypothetical protein [Ruminococcus sp.]
MGMTLENAKALRQIATNSLNVSVQISDDAKRFMTNSNAIGGRCEEFWTQIESSSMNAKHIAEEAAKVLSSYSELMVAVAEKIEASVNSNI